MWQRLERFAPLAGVVFLILVAASFVVGGVTPDNDDPTARIVAFWHNEESRQTFAAALFGLAGLFLVWFAGSLRRSITRAEGDDDRLATIAFAGAVIAAIGLLIFASLAFAAADTAGKVPPEVTHTLTVLGNEFFFPLAGGSALLFVAAGLAFLRTGMLPAWLGWLSIAAGILAVTPIAFFAVLAMIIWVAALGVVLYLRRAG